MPDSFDPYRVWLGVPSGSRPPTHYQLLGIAPIEQDQAVIESAVLRQSGYVRNFQIGKHAKEAARILNEIAAAKACLQDPVKRSKYDAELNDAQIAAQPALPVPARATKISAVGVIRPLDIDLDGFGVPLAPLEPRPLTRRRAAPVRRIQATAPRTKLLRGAWYGVAGGATLAVTFALMFAAFLTRRRAEDITTSDAAMTRRAPSDTATPSVAMNLAPTIEITIDPEAPEAGGSLDIWFRASDPDDDTVEIAYRTDSSGAWLLATGGRVTLRELKEGLLSVEARARDSGGHESGVIAKSVDVRPTAPPFAVAPFSANEAQRLQRAWAKRLRTEPVETSSIGMKLVLIPPGEFLMGLPRSEVGPAAETQHFTRITRAFYLGSHEVTQSQYCALMVVNPSHFSPSGNGKNLVNGIETSEHPVENVGWLDAIKFCNKLSKKENLSPCYSRQGATVTLLEGSGYRLPTEAEWEYACRAGTITKWSFGNNERELERYAWFASNAAGRTHRVGELQTNHFGLYDTHGNTWEWCWDLYGERYYARSPTEDPQGPSTGSQRMLCGGGWYVVARGTGSASRAAPIDPPTAHVDRGFRVARAVPLTASARQLEDRNLIARRAVPKIVRTSTQTYTDGRNVASCTAQTFAVSIGQSIGFGIVGYEIEGIRGITLETTLRGARRAYDDNSFAGFIADYHTPAGYTRRVAMSLDISARNRNSRAPDWWGKGAIPDQFVDLPRSAVHQLALADWAPAEWDGRVWISALIQNSGRNTSIVGRIVDLIGREEPAVGVRPGTSPPPDASL